MKKIKWLWLVALVLVLINILTIYLLPREGKLLLAISDIFPVVTSLIALIYLGLTYKKFVDKDYARLTWQFLFWGILLYTLAESIYGYMEIVLEYNMNEVFPSVGDYFWCLGYIPFIAALILMLRGFRKSGLPTGKTWVYVVLIAGELLVFAIISFVLLWDMLKDPDSGWIEKVFYLFYPIMDVVVVALAATILYITSLFGNGAVTMPWRMLAFGFILFTIADLIYSYLGWLDRYETGNLIEVAWNAGYLSIAIGALYQTELIESVKQKQG